MNTLHTRFTSHSRLSLTGVALLCFALTGACGPLPRETPWDDTDGTGGTFGGTSGEGEGEPKGLGFDHLRPNVMLLVDRSGSMAQPGSCAESECPSRWDQLVALGPYLSEVSRSARLGMAMFPGPNGTGCAVDGAVMVPLSDDTDSDQQVLDAWESVVPGGQTPLAAGLDAIADVGALEDPLRDNVLVVLTDGRPNCACNQNTACETSEAVDAVDRLVNRAVPLNIYFVGFGTSIDDTAADTLETMAAVAATEHGQGAYFQVDTIEELIGLMYQVSQELRSCSFDLDERPEASQLVAWFDNQEVPACAGDCDEGYTYDVSNGIVELKGSWCETLNDGGDHQVWFDSRD